jgi:hypothetical protein
MNQRIQQLAEQARQYAEDKQNNPLKIYTLDCFNEKFAELIVQECASKVDFILRERRDGGGTMGDKIREHFGVDYETK